MKTVDAIKGLAVINGALMNATNLMLAAQQLTARFLEADADPDKAVTMDEVRGMQALSRQLMADVHQRMEQLAAQAQGSDEAG